MTSVSVCARTLCVHVRISVAITLGARQCDRAGVPFGSRHCCFRTRRAQDGTQNSSGRPGGCGRGRPGARWPGRLGPGGGRPGEQDRGRARRVGDGGCTTEYDISTSGASVKPVTTSCTNNTNRTLLWERVNPSRMARDLDNIADGYRRVQRRGRTTRRTRSGRPEVEISCRSGSRGPTRGRPARRT
jgi:hypothetical protein